MDDVPITNEVLTARAKDAVAAAPGWDKAEPVMTVNGVEVVVLPRTVGKVAIGRKNGKAVFVVTFAPAGRVPGSFLKANRVGLAWRDEKVKATAGLLTQVYFDVILAEFGAASTATHYTDAGRAAAESIAKEAAARGFLIVPGIDTTYYVAP